MMDITLQLLSPAKLPLALSLLTSHSKDGAKNTTGLFSMKKPGILPRYFTKTTSILIGKTPFFVKLPLKCELFYLGKISGFLSKRFDWIQHCLTPKGSPFMRSTGESLILSVNGHPAIKVERRSSVAGIYE